MSSVQVMRRLSFVAFGLSCLAFLGACILWLPHNSIAEFVASPVFVMTYVGIIAVMVLWRMMLDWRTLRREQEDVNGFLRRLEDVGSTEFKSRLLLSFAEDNSPSVRKERDAPRIAFMAQSDLLRRVLLLLQHARATVPSKLYEQGVLPSAYGLRAYGIGSPFRSSAAADLVIRVALLGTFVGIVAALTIASGGLTSGSASGSGRLSEMQGILQQLLASAAAKFWISAAGLAGAIILLTFERYCLRAASALTERVGSALDEILSDPAAARALCRLEKLAEDPIQQQLYKIAEQIKASADKWVLTVKIGGANAANVPSVSLGPAS